MSNKTNFISKINNHIRINNLFDENMTLFSYIKFDEIHHYNEKHNPVIFNYLKTLINQYFESDDLEKPSLLRKIKIMNYLFVLYIKDNSHFPNEMNNLDFVNCLYKSIGIFDTYIDDFSKNNWEVNDFSTTVIKYVKEEIPFSIEPRLKQIKSKKNVEYDSTSQDDSMSKYRFYKCPLIITFITLFLECVITSGKMPDIKTKLIYCTEQFENSFIEFNNNVPIEERKTFLENYVEEIKNHLHFSLLHNYKWELNSSSNVSNTNNVLFKEYNVMVLIFSIVKKPVLVKSILFSGIFVESKLFITGSGATFETIKRQQTFNRVIENVIGKIKSFKNRCRIRPKPNKPNRSKINFLEEPEDDDFSNDISEKNLENTNLIGPVEKIFCRKRTIDDVFYNKELIDFFYFPFDFVSKRKYRKVKNYVTFYLEPGEKEFLNYCLF